MESACGFYGLHPWELPWDADCAHPDSARFSQQLQEHLTSMAVQQNVTHFLVSMDGGASLLAAEGVLAMKAFHPVTLECVIPFEEVHAQWPEAERERYFSILERCDVEQMMNRSFSLTCYRRCARYLADRCDTLLILWNERPGDAGDAVTLARRSGRRVVLLSPYASKDTLQ